MLRGFSGRLLGAGRRLRPSEPGGKRLGLYVFDQAEVVVIKLSGQAPPERVKIREKIAGAARRATAT